MPEPLLETSGLTRRFGGLVAMSEVSLGVEPGEIHAVIGPNGAGKTTLFNVISGDMPQTSGTIEFLGQDIGTIPAPGRTRLGMGRTYQKSRLFLGLSVEDNLYLAVLGSRGGHLRLTRKRALDGEMRERARELARTVGLDTQIDSLVGSISHGEQRQLEVAMALATRPRLLLLDEPMAGMGTEESQRMIAFLATLKRKQTIILVEHDMDAVFRLADRISVLVYGRVIATDVPEKIKLNEEVRKAYLGEAG
jgi:branched-chain amino acid transport system ATP-binding protein